jgi:hypothetical protein
MIPDPGSGIPDPHQRMLVFIYNPKNGYWVLNNRPGMFIPDPGSWLWIFSIPDPGSGSRIQGSKRHRIRNTLKIYTCVLIYLFVGSLEKTIWHFISVEVGGQVLKQRRVHKCPHGYR